MDRFEEFLGRLHGELVGVVGEEESKAVVMDARAHLEDLHTELVLEGMGEDEACMEAIARFGDVKTVKDGYRENWWSFRLEGVERVIAGLYILLLGLAVLRECTTHWAFSSNSLGRTVLGEQLITLSTNGLALLTLLIVLISMKCKRLLLSYICIFGLLLVCLTTFLSAGAYAPHPLGGVYQKYTIPDSITGEDTFLKWEWRDHSYTLADVIQLRTAMNEEQMLAFMTTTELHKKNITKLTEIRAAENESWLISLYPFLIYQLGRLCLASLVLALFSGFGIVIGLVIRQKSNSSANTRRLV